ncbi:unnamed protein product [Tetraodon nigroviridis]|uniref:Chromosome undetermined SCAF7605, whole genome shotgun sequence n=1 Tax=Tetraodon nigroviridis TaxID=99883 RepID=Q4T9B0_TETNG|nr:unnamed protein product [Tetraodon nigroviridis]
MEFSQSANIFPAKRWRLTNDRKVGAVTWNHQEKSSLSETRHSGTMISLKRSRSSSSEEPSEDFAGPTRSSLPHSVGSFRL